MATISVSSGPITFDKKNDQEPKRGGSNSALRVLVLGNFSGDTPRTLPLEARRHLRLDRDSFDEVFARLGVRLVTPLGSEPVRFQSLDELHPDHLYDSLALFARYRSLKKQLRSPSQFANAVAALRETGLIAETIPQQSAPPVQPQDNFWDSLLSSQAASSQTIDQLIRQTIAPYLEAKPHPQTEEYSAAVNQAENQLMRQLMHASAFQQLEASWRSLDLLQRRLDLDHSCHLFVLDASIAELLADLEQAQGDNCSTALHRNFIQSNHQYDVVLLDHAILAESDSLNILSLAMDIAEQMGAVLLGGGAAALAGKQDFSLNSDQPLPEAISQTWSQLRQRSEAARVFIAAPRYLVRLPFGKKTAATDNFAYEELPEQGAHPYYLWGNGAYLLLLAMAGAREQFGSATQLAACRIEDMPLHAYVDEEGDSALQPCAEVYLSEPKVQQLEQAGLTVLQSVQNANSIFVGRWNPLKLSSTG
jgi:type VI secretion system protein ImpC